MFDRSKININNVGISVPLTWIPQTVLCEKIITSADVRAPLEGELEWLIKIYEETGVCEHTAVYWAGSKIYPQLYCYICGERI